MCCSLATKSLIGFPDYTVYIPEQNRNILVFLYTRPSCFNTAYLSNLICLNPLPSFTAPVRDRGYFKQLQWRTLLCNLLCHISFLFLRKKSNDGPTHKVRTGAWIEKQVTSVTHFLNHVMKKTRSLQSLQMFGNRVMPEYMWGKWGSGEERWLVPWPFL